MFAIMAVTGVPNLRTDLFNTVFCIVLISISLQGTLIPWVADKLKMLDANADVMKTFNDYAENSEMQSSQIDIKAKGPWDGKMIKELELPKNMLVALVIRNGERIIARGDTQLGAGDKAIVVTKSFEDSETYLIEKTVKPNGKRAGHAIREFPAEGLVLLIRRGTKEIIPHGDTILHEGDSLVILKTK